MRLIVVLLTLISVVRFVPTARAACDRNGADAGDIATARAAVATNCSCAGASHGVYVSCAAQQAKATLVNHDCLGQVTRCAARSTCGRPGFVTCCRTNSKGVTKCSIKNSATVCKAPHGGSACTGTLSSCCDACQNGGCVGTTTTTSVTGSTCTSTTTFPPCHSLGGGFCGGVCSTGQACQGDGVGGCSCVGPPVDCAFSNHSVCSTGVCPSGEACHLVVDDAACGIVHCGCDPTPTTTSTSSSTTTTYSTCTTTSLNAPCARFGAFCGGACSTGQVCQDDGAGGCTCVGPPVPCYQAYPSVCAATGTCPPGQSCQQVLIPVPGCVEARCTCR